MIVRTRLLALLTLPLLYAAGNATAGELAPAPHQPTGAAAPTRPAGSQEPAAPSTERGGARFVRARAGLSRVWWNQPKEVEALGLTEEQRRRMDGALTAHLEARRKAARSYVETRRRLGDELAAGDWKAAEKTAREAGEIFASMARSEGELALAVAQVLEPEQRKKLDTEFPLLLRRPLVQGGLGLRGGTRAFRRHAAAPGGS